MFQEIRTKSQHTDIAFDSDFSPTFYGPYRNLHFPNKCSASLLFQFSQKRWSLRCQQPLRGALGYGPFICTVPLTLMNPYPSHLVVIQTAYVHSCLLSSRLWSSHCCHRTHTTFDETNKQKNTDCPRHQWLSGLDLATKHSVNSLCPCLERKQLCTFPPTS